MYKSDFGRESYGCLKLALPISKGGVEMPTYPHFLFCPNLFSSRTSCPASMVMGTHILGP